MINKEIRIVSQRAESLENMIVFGLQIFVVHICCAHVMKPVIILVML